MKSLTSKKLRLFTCEDLPIALLIYRQDNGKILVSNQAAKKLFGIRRQALNIKKFRPDEFPENGKRTRGFLDIGPVVHKTTKGKTVNLLVRRKQLKWDDQDCWADFLEPVPSNQALKNQITQTSLDAFISIDEKQIVHDWNPAAEKIFGWKKSEAVGNVLVDLIIPKEYKKNHLHGVSHYFKTGEHRILNKLIEIVGQHKKGYLFPVELTVTPAHESGKTMFYAFVRDISDRKKVDQILRDSEEKLKRAQAIASVGSWEMYGDFQELHWSDEFYRIHGLEPGSVKPSTKLRLAMTHPHDREKLQKAISEAAHEGKPYTIEKRIIRPNNEVRWVLSQGEATIDEKTGKRKVFGTLLDITERKRMEEKYHLANQSLADFQGAIQSSSIVSRADKAGIITYVNENFVKISGYSALELIGKNHHIINSGYHPKSFWVNMWKTIASGKTWRAEVKNKAKDGSEYWVDTFIMPFLDSKGRVKEFLSIRNDITSRKQFETDLNQSNTRLSETLIFGKMGSAELDLTTFNLTISKELLVLLDIEAGTSQQQPINQFLKKYVLPEYLAIINQKIKEGSEGLDNTKRVVEVEFEMITATGRKIWIAAKGIFKNKIALGILQDITDQKIATQKSVERAKTIEVMLNGITDGFFAMDQNLNFVLINPVFAALAKKTPEEMLNKNILEVFPFMKKDILYKQYRDAIHTGKAFTTETKGELYQQIFQVNGYPNANGLFIYFKDISQVKKVEWQLKEANELFRRLSTNVPGMIYNFYLNQDNTGVFPFVSSGSQNLFGISATDLMQNGNKLFEKIHPDDRDRVMNSIKQAALKQKSWVAEFRILFNKDTEKWVSAASTPYQESDGRDLWYGFMQDITEIKRVHQQISNLTDTIPDGFIYEFWQSYDGSDYKINYISQGCERLFEVKMEDAIKKADSLFSLIHPDDITPFFKLVEEKRKQPGRFDIDYRIVMPDGRIKWVNGRANVRLLPDQSAIIEGIALDVTRQKKLEHEEQEAKTLLRKSENNLRAILNASTDSTFFMDQSGHILMANQKAFKKVKDLLQVEFKIGDSFTSFLPESSQEKFIASFSRALSGEVVQVEREISFNQSKKIWISASYLPVRNTENEIIGVSFTATDITQRKFVELALVQSEERLRALYNNTPAMMHSVDNQGRLIRVSDFWLQKMEYSREEVLGKPLSDFLVLASQKKANEVYLPEFFKTGKITNAEYQFITKSGKVLETLLSASSEYESGVMVKSMAVVTDISDRKKLEQEVGKLAFMVSRTSNAILLTDVEGKITWVNAGFERLTGYHLEEIYGREPGDFLQGPETSPDVIRQMKHALKMQEGFKVEVLNYTKTGKPIWLDVEVMPIKNEQGQVTGFMAIESDITNLKNALQEMQRSEQTLHAFMDHSPMVAFVKDLNGHYTFYNKVYRDFMHPKILKSGFTDYDLFDKDFADLCVTRDKHIAETGETLQFEHPVGRQTFLEYKFPLKDVYDKVFAVGGISLNITEKLEAQKKIAENEARLRGLTDNLPNGVVFEYQADTNGKILNFPYVSSGSLGLFGYTPEEIRENPMILFDQVEPDFLPAMMAAGETSRLTLGDFEFEYAIKTRDNQQKWVQTRSKPKRLSNGNTEWSGITIDVSEQKKSENKLRESELRFRYLADTAPVLIWMSGTDKLCNYFNKGWLEFTGRPIEKELGNGWAEGVHPDDLERCVQIYESSFDLRQRFQMEYRLRRHDGEYRWIIDEGAPRFLPTGEFAGYIGSCIDIHDSIEARNKLTENELRLRTILETEPECVKILNSKGELVEMNRAGLDMIEAESIDQVKGHEMVELVHESHRQDFIQLTREVFKGNSGMLEFEMTGLKGTSRWLETHAVPMKNTQGQVTSLLGVTRDITHRKESEKTLRESEERYRKLFDLNPVPTWMYDLDSLKFLQVNKAAIEHYGFTNEEFLNMRILDIRPSHEQERLLARIESLKNKTSQFDQQQLYWQHQKKDGTPIDVEILSTEFKIDKKNARLVTVNDVTEKIKNENRLIAALKDKDSLIKEIHHRVKNNLQLISSILYIRMVGMKQSEIKMFLQETRQKIHSIALIHERLLQTESVNTVDISDYLNKLILDLQMTILSQDKKITLQASIDSVSMNLDMAINCGLILNELVTNSAKHAFINQVAGTIKISLSHQAGKFQFIVADDGCGLPENVNLGAGGFGMQVLDVFVKQLKGTVEISRENGTSFKIIF